MADKTDLELRNEQYKAERAYDYAAPDSDAKKTAMDNFKRVTMVIQKRKAKKKKAKEVSLGSGLAEKAKEKLLSRREQLDKAMRDAGA